MTTKKADTAAKTTPRTRTGTTAAASPRKKPAPKAVAAAKKKPAAKTVPAAKKSAAKPRVSAAAANKKPAAKPRASAAKPKTAAAPRKTPAKRAPRKTAVTNGKTTARPGTRKKTSRAAKPKGLEAQYSGKIFRSRLEARWAILMDLLDINWDYEPSHYQVGPALWYLPDFYLPEHRLWLEVKGPVFMDAQSMAKCIGSIAGPMPLPLREAPYTAADRLLIGGPLRLRQGMTARHTLVTKDVSGKAALSYASVSRGGIRALGQPWDRVEANGVAKARRPLPDRLQVLVDPDPAFGVKDSEAERAYRIAAGAVFDDASKALSGTTDPSIIRELARRRGGRPLGPFPAS